MPLPEFEEFMERIARGSMSSNPTPVSSTFSKEMVILMEKEDCIAGDTRGQGDSKNLNLDMTKLKHKMKEERVIDVELFN